MKNKQTLIKECIASSNNTNLIRRLHFKVKSHFKLTDKQLELVYGDKACGDKAWLWFVGPKLAFGSAGDVYLRLLPKLIMYCEGFLAGWDQCIETT